MRFGPSCSRLPSSSSECKAPSTPSFSVCSASRRARFHLISVRWSTSAGPHASVLIPTRQPGPAIRDVLASIFSQHTAFEYEVVIVDSGSRPHELQLMRSFPVRLHEIPPAEFGHGRTRNLLGHLARGQVLLYLSQDAEPATSSWMQTLATSINGHVAGSYARQLPRPDADPLMRFFLRTTYGPTPARRQLAARGLPRLGDIFFSNVSSALRHDAWLKVPFRENVVMSEDQYWAFDALRAGYEVIYEPAAQVYHSHNYTLRGLFRRNWLSGASLRGLTADSSAAVARRGLVYVAAEARYLVQQRNVRWLPYMLLYEATKALGFALGSAPRPLRLVSPFGQSIAGSGKLEADGLN
ncbi:MAG: glycosyltransferase [Chloroflexi bacterium]|nr:glycosyltransferase [Chloroflexota bacterium]